MNPAFTLEALLTHPEAFGLETASPLQRAVCRLADGLPLGELAAHADVAHAIGDAGALPAAPRELLVLSGIRTGKSLLAAALAVRAALTCDLERLRPGETPRVSVLSLTVDLGRVVFDHLVVPSRASPLCVRWSLGNRAPTRCSYGTRPGALWRSKWWPALERVRRLLLAGRRAASSMKRPECSARKTAS